MNAKPIEVRDFYDLPVEKEMGEPGAGYGTQSLRNDVTEPFLDTHLALNQIDERHKWIEVSARDTSTDIDKDIENGNRRKGIHHELDRN